MSFWKSLQLSPLKSPLHNNIVISSTVARSVLPVIPTFDHQRRALDEMVAILLEAGGDGMMDRSNFAGQTPRRLQSKKLDMWQKQELAAIAREEKKKRSDSRLYITEKGK